MASEILAAWKAGVTVDEIIRIFDVTATELCAIIDSH